MTKPINIASLETGSGIAWDEWVTLLKPLKDAPHGEIAKAALEHIEERGRASSPGWWAQSVAVAYEQHIGRRQPGQAANGSFNVTVSKTVSGTMDEVLHAWTVLVKDMTEFNKVKIIGDPRISKTEKWRYWRCTLEDGSVVGVSIQTKPEGGKSLLAVTQDKLPSAKAVEKSRLYWKEFLNS